MIAASSVARAREAANAEHDASAAGYRDDNTYEHTQRVGLLAAKLARELGLPDRKVALIGHAAPLHDMTAASRTQRALTRRRVTG